MAAKVRYVRTRNDVFQYERRVPLSIQRTPHFASLFHSNPLFRRSLGTKLQTEMFDAAAKVHAEFEDLVTQASGRPRILSPEVKTPLKKVAEADLQRLAERYRELTRAPFERALLKADIDHGSAEEYERIKYDLERDAERLLAELERRGPNSDDPGSPWATAKFVVEREGFDAPVDTSAFASVVNAIRSGTRLGYNDINDLIMGKRQPQSPESVIAKKVGALTLRNAVTLYLDHRKLPPKTATEVDLSLKTFEGLCGNKTLEALHRADFVRFVEHLAGRTVGGKTVGSVSRHLNAATIKKRLGFLRSAINHTIDRHLFDGRNPANDIKVEAWAKPRDIAQMPDKRRFNVGELNAIFQHPWFTGCKSANQTFDVGSHRLNGSEYWVPMVALFTGCRASELGGLRLAEVKLDDPHPHFVIRDNQYSRTKGGYQRYVPILDALIETGFEAYVAHVTASGADRLFPDWTSRKHGKDERNDDADWANGRIIRAFNRTVIPSMLGKALNSGARREVTFHSLRGTFKAMLVSAKSRPHPNIINEVMGHAKSELDARYIGTISINETYAAVHECRFDGLVLPPAP